MTVSLNELSSVYREFISEEDQTPEAVAQRVAQMVKAIRYRARKEASPLSKAFNDYIGSVNATSVERQAVKERLGLTGGVSHKEEYVAEKSEVEVPTGNIAKLAKKASARIDSDVSGSIDSKDSTDKTMGVFIPSPDGKKRVYGTRVKESFSDWRQDLSEVMDEVEANRQIKEKKVKNKVVINPVMKEAIGELGGEILEMVEVSEERNDEPGEGTKQKYGDMRGIDRSGSPTSFGGKWQSKERKAAGAAALAKLKKEEAEIDEAVYGGTPAKKEEPKDTRYTVTAADKKGNTVAYQKYKAGDKRYKAASHLGEENEIEEGMTMKDFKKQRSRQKQKEKRAADKIAPGRRAGIHADKASPERAARHRANVDPDFEGNDERNYPGGKLRPNKVRKAKALGELGEGTLQEKALSKQQQKFMGMVYAVKKGEMEAPSPEVAKAAASMTKQQAKDFAKTKHKGLPNVKEAVMDEPIDKSANDKISQMQKKKIQAQKIRELNMRLQAARKGVY